MENLQQLYNAVLMLPNIKYSDSELGEMDEIHTKAIEIFKATFDTAQQIQMAQKICDPDSPDSGDVLQQWQKFKECVQLHPRESTAGYNLRNIFNNIQQLDF